MQHRFPPSKLAGKIKESRVLPGAEGLELAAWVICHREHLVLPVLGSRG